MDRKTGLAKKARLDKARKPDAALKAKKVLKVKKADKARVDKTKVVKTKAKKVVVASESEGEDDMKDRKEMEEMEEMEKEDMEEMGEMEEMEEETETAETETAPTTASAAPKTFEELGLAKVLCDICRSLNYTVPTPIQAAAIPVALQGRDLIAAAETGSGKTLAFVLPVLHGLLERPRPYAGLILAPTRELALQIGEQLNGFAGIQLRTTVLVGGVDKTMQRVSLAKRPHVIVATPGRLLDHLEGTKGFVLRSSLGFLVIDEADRMLDMDFGPVFTKILQHLPRERRTMLFSATMSAKVETLQRASLRSPVRVSVQGGGLEAEVAQTGQTAQTVRTLTQNMWLVPHKRKDAAFVFLVQRYAGRTMIVFVRTVAETVRLRALLRALGFAALSLNGRMSQPTRMAAINRLRAGASQILIATDVASRGLDIPNVHVVVNYDVPQDSSSYVHRVGRTARAGQAGLAVSLVTQYDMLIFLRVEKAVGLERQIQPLPDVTLEDARVYEAHVDEAQRIAKAELRTWWDEQNARRGGRGGRADRGAHRVMGGRADRDDMDLEEI